MTFTFDASRLAPLRVDARTHFLECTITFERAHLGCLHCIRRENGTHLHLAKILVHPRENMDFDTTRLDTTQYEPASQHACYLGLFPALSCYSRGVARAKLKCGECHITTSSCSLSSQDNNDVHIQPVIMNLPLEGSSLVARLSYAHRTNRKKNDIMDTCAATRLGEPIEKASRFGGSENSRPMNG